MKLKITLLVGLIRLNFMLIHGSELNHEKEFSNIQYELFNWVRNNGGYVSESIELAESSIHDNMKIRGVYATNNISEGDILLELNERTMMCDSSDCALIKFLGDHLKDANNSYWYPYLHGMQNREVDIPALWNAFELSFLDGLYPQDWTLHKDLLAFCDFEVEDPIYLRSMILIATRSVRSDDHFCMSPVYDLFNHIHMDLRNTNTDSGLDEDGHRMLSMTASKDIAAGEQLYNSYGREDVGSMLRDYGFLVSPPHLWRITGQDGMTYSFLLDWSGEMIELDVNPESVGHQEDMVQMHRQLHMHLLQLTELGGAIDDRMKRHHEMLESSTAGDSQGAHRLDLATRYRQEYIFALNLALTVIESKLPVVNIEQ